MMLSLERFTAKPIGFWTMKNMQKFMENVARSQNMDPHLPETWCNISAGDIKQMVFPSQSESIPSNYHLCRVGAPY